MECSLRFNKNTLVANLPYPPPPTPQTCFIFNRLIRIH